MTVKKQRRLGRGLEALLSATPESDTDTTQPSDSAVAESGSGPLAYSSPIPARDSQLRDSQIRDSQQRIPQQRDALPLSLKRPDPRTALSPIGNAAGNGSGNQVADAAAPKSQVYVGTASTEGRLFQLNVYEIDDNPFQPRREFSEPEIASLSESLKEHDMLQPVLVRRIDNRYQLISGERRLRAAIQAGWSTVPAQIREADDRLVAELAIVENLQRKDLNPLEKALSFRRYIEEHDCKQEKLAERLKIDRSTIANLMRLLDLPRVVQDALRTDLVSAGHARALLPLPTEAKQIEFCNRIQAEGWSVRDTERLVKEFLSADGKPDAAKPTKRKPNKSEQVASLENELRMSLGTKVDIKQSSRGKGQIVIHFTNANEFERLRELMAESQSRDVA
jgi:ParB family chromosome partitioning protein